MNPAFRTADPHISKDPDQASVAVPDRGAPPAQWSAIALGFSLPISVALDNLLIAAFLVAFAAADNLRKALPAVRHDPVSISALALAAMMIVGMSWSPEPAGELGKSFVDARNFMLVPLFMIVFRDESTRHRAMDAFLAANAVILFLSFLLWSGVVERLPQLKGNATYPIVFKYHITHSFLLAIAVLMFVQRARRSEGLLKVACYGGALLASVNVLFMIPGRTGQLALIATGFFVAFGCYRWRGLAAIVVATCVMMVGVWLTPNSIMHQRAAVAWHEATTYRAEGVAREDSSIGLRLEFYRNALTMVLDRPFLGTGTGGFEKSYGSLVASRGLTVPNHPHNSFLLIATELGLIGLATMLALLATAWACARRIPNLMDRTMARAVLLMFILGGLFSATFTDHAESLFFAWILGNLWNTSAPPTAAWCEDTA